MKVVPFRKRIVAPVGLGLVRGALACFALSFGDYLGQAIGQTSTTAATEPQITSNLFQLPSSRVAQASLQTEARFYWEQTQLRTGIQELGKVYGLSMWIDREIDPNQLINVAVAPADTAPTLASRLKQIATQAGGQIGLVENVVYLGPTGRVASLQRAAVELHNLLSQGNDAQLTSLRELSWPELVSSSELIEVVEKNWRINMEGELPHDLFHSGEFLQASTLATQLTVLLGGFDRQASWIQRNRFRIEPLSQRQNWQAAYRPVDLDLRNLSELGREYPGSQVQTRGAINLVSGPTDFHLALFTPMRSRPSAVPRSREQRWGFSVENAPVEAVIDRLAGAIGFQVNWDAACTAEVRQQLISFKVDQASTEEMLAEIARVSGLTIIRDAKQLNIKP